MSRLTLPHYSGKGHYMKCSEQFGCSGECADCEELDKIVEKLAEYEDKEALKPQTNADRIRAMSDEELADWLARTQIANVAEALEIAKIPYEQEDGIKNEVAKECLEWLQQPAGEE